MAFWTECKSLQPKKKETGKPHLWLLLIKALSENAFPEC